MFWKIAPLLPRQTTDRFVPGILGDVSIYTKRDRRVTSNKCLVGSVRTRNSKTPKSWDIREAWIATFSNILRRRSMRLTSITFLRMAHLCRINITQIGTRALEDGLLYFLIQTLQHIQSQRLCVMNMAEWTSSLLLVDSLELKRSLTTWPTSRRQLRHASFC